MDVIGEAGVSRYSWRYSECPDTIERTAFVKNADAHSAFDFFSRCSRDVLCDTKYYKANAGTHVCPSESPSEPTAEGCLLRSRWRSRAPRRRDARCFLRFRSPKVLCGLCGVRRQRFEIDIFLGHSGCRAQVRWSLASSGGAPLYVRRER